MPDLNSLVVFAKVVEANSFSEAARRLKMPVSTVSRKIADLEAQLGTRLLDRSTRSLRLTDIGAEVLGHAQSTAEMGDAIESIVSNNLDNVTGLLRLSAPPSISETLLTPLVCAFQAAYPDVRVQILITDRFVDHIAEGVDLVLRLGDLKDSSLVARKVLTYRHRLVASPDYLRNHAPPETPEDLLDHRLLAFSYWKPNASWTFVEAATGQARTLSFLPYLSMNDFAGLAPALVAGGGIGDLPPIVQPQLFDDGLLVEVMPRWRFRPFDLSIVHLGNRQVSRPIRVFKDFVVKMAPKLFPELPT